MNNPTIPNTSALINWTNFLMMPYEIEVLTETSFIDEQIVTLLESDIPFIHNVDGNQLLVPYNKSTLKQQSKLTPDFLEKPITSQKQLLDYLEEMIGGGFCFMCSIKGGMKSNFTSDNCCNDTIIRDCSITTGVQRIQSRMHLQRVCRFRLCFEKPLLV